MKVNEEIYSISLASKQNRWQISGLICIWYQIKKKGENDNLFTSFIIKYVLLSLKGFTFKTLFLPLIQIYSAWPTGNKSCCVSGSLSEWYISFGSKS